jgi:hypothetical protein
MNLYFFPQLCHLCPFLQTCHLLRHRQSLYLPHIRLGPCCVFIAIEHLIFRMRRERRLLHHKPRGMQRRSVLQEAPFFFPLDPIRPSRTSSILRNEAALWPSWQPYEHPVSRRLERACWPTMPRCPIVASLWLPTVASWNFCSIPCWIALHLRNPV